MIGTIIYNEDKEKAVKLYKKLVDFFQKSCIEIVPKTEIERSDFAVVLGGDGTLLRASKQLIKKNGIDVFAINAGNLGFLTEIKEEEFFKTFEDYINGKVKRECRRFLELSIDREKYDILNEVVISKEKISSKMINIVVDSRSGRVCTYRADGVIIATPTGSTAYSLSAGGPILMPKIRAMIVTPIAPHNLTSRAIVVDGDEKLSFTLKKGERASIVIDGESERKITNEERIEIYYSNKNINLILPENRDYYSILREKLRWGDNLC